MKLNSVIISLCVILFGILLMSAQDHDEDELKIIAQGVEIKIEEFLIRHEKNCRERAVTNAVGIVDSMVRAGGYERRVKSVEKPLRPSKPGMPAIKSLPDSLSHQDLRRED